jgi:hypothetical protein
MRKLTQADLIKAEACRKAETWFMRNFPNGTFCSKGDIAKLTRDKGACPMVWSLWAGHRLLRRDGRGIYKERVFRGESPIDAFAYAWRHQNDG